MSNESAQFDRALGYIAHGQIDSAIELLCELLGENPDNADYHAVLAGCLVNQKRLTGAGYELDVAQRLDPNLPYVYLVRSRIQLLHRKLGQALDSTSEALRLDPEYVDALLMQANLYQLQNKPSAALDQLQCAAELEPAKTDVIVAFGNYYLAQGDASAAMEKAHEAMRIDAGSDDANVLMGECLLALGDTPEADMHARYAVSQNPHNRSALRLLVDVRMRENWFVGIWWRFNNAITHLTSAQQGMVLILGYLVFQLTSQLALDFGYETLGNTLRYAWLAIALYSWVALPMYQRALQKTLSEFKFNPKF